MIDLLPAVPSVQYDALLRLIAAVAADVWQETPILDHVEAVAGDQRDALLALVTESMDYSQHDDGSMTPEYFLDMTQWFWGGTYDSVVRDLRELAQRVDPAADDRSYGQAARIAKQRHKTISRPTFNAPVVPDGHGCSND